ncbi:monocarboxylate transporter 2-like [Convolutriloba macropyga]|uniref:monocarboxylate transporter 2-like n=1 Tax=Convolutriloba macropyga TaxID=536237 RepID=UPI003F527B71
MASFSYFYDSEHHIYELIKFYNRQLPHRPKQQPRNSSKIGKQNKGISQSDYITYAINQRDQNDNHPHLHDSSSLSPVLQSHSLPPPPPSTATTNSSRAEHSVDNQSRVSSHSLPKCSSPKLGPRSASSSGGSCKITVPSGGAGGGDEGQLEGGQKRGSRNSRGSGDSQASSWDAKLEASLLVRMRSKARQQTSWAIVVVTMIVFIPIIGTLFSFGVFIPAIEPDFHVHKTVMGWIASIPVAFLTGANPISCSLSVRFGYRPVIFAGVLLVVFGLFIVSAANHAVIIFISYSVFVGVGVNFVYNSCMLLLLSYFSIEETKHNLSRACCIASFGFPIGLLVMNPLAVQLLNHYGWRVALRIIGMICFCNIIAVYVVIKPPQVNNLMNKYIPRNSRTGSVKRFMRRLRHRDLILDPCFYLWLISVMCLWITLYFVPIHLVSDMMASGGMSSSQASFVLVVAGLSELAGRVLSAIVPNMFSLRVSYFLLPACFCLSCVNFLFGFGKLPSTEYAIFYGVCAGVVNSTMIVACKEFFGNKYFHEAWTYSGIVYMASVVLGNTLGGLPFDLTGKYEMVYKAFGAIHAFAFCVLLMVNCIMSKREQAESQDNRPLEQRQEVSAIYKINSSEEFHGKVLQKRFQRFSESTIQSGSSNTFQFHNEGQMSRTFSRTSETGSERNTPVLMNTLSPHPRKSSLRNSTSTASPTLSTVAFGDHHSMNGTMNSIGSRNNFSSTIEL